MGGSGGSTDRLTIQQHKWGARKMLNKTLQAPTQNENAKIKPGIIIWENYKAKVDDLCLTTYLAKRREKELFPSHFSVLGDRHPKPLPTLHRAARSAAHYAHLSEPFQQPSHSVFSVCLTLFPQWASLLLQPGRKNNLHVKNLAGDICFQNSNFRTRVYLPFNTKILWNDPINSNIGGNYL